MLLLRNIRIIDTHSSFNGQEKDILIENGSILSIKEAFSIVIENQNIAIMEGGCVSPGWVDMQVHLSEPGYEWKETLVQTAAAAVKGGFTTIVAYPCTNPVLDNAQTLRFCKEKAKDLPIEVLFTGALTQGTEGKDYADLYEMHSEGAIAFTDALHYPQSAGVMLRLRQYLSSFGGKMMLCPSDATLVGEGQMNEGKAALNVGMKGIPEIAELIALSKELTLHSYAPVNTHFQPLTSPQSLALFQKKKAEFPEITCGIPAFYLSLTDEVLADFDTNYKVFPPLRSPEQVEKIRQYVQNGTIDVISSGHFPQGLEEKQTEFDAAENGMLGLQTAFSIAAQALKATQDFDTLAALVDKFTHNPRKILGLPTLSIEEGNVASLTLFHPNETWKLSTEMIPSTAKNTPFLGKELPVVVKGIVHKGKFIATR